MSNTSTLHKQSQNYVKNKIMSENYVRIASNVKTKVTKIKQMRQKRKFLSETSNYLKTLQLCQKVTNVSKTPQLRKKTSQFMSKKRQHYVNNVTCICHKHNQSHEHVKIT